MYLDGLAQPLRPSGEGAWEVDGGTIVGRAGPRTDLFIDPADGTRTLNAPRALFTPAAGDFQLRARVEVEFAATYDAGVLLLWADDTTWSKLCFELSPQGTAMVVSIVTRGVSDDANGFAADATAVWLRISRRRAAHAFHASTDGSYWQLIRHFSLGDSRPQAGLEVQSPTGSGLVATFTDLAYGEETLGDLRDGT